MEVGAVARGHKLLLFSDLLFVACLTCFFIFIIIIFNRTQETISGVSLPTMPYRTVCLEPDLEEFS